MLVAVVVLGKVVVCWISFASSWLSRSVLLYLCLSFRASSVSSHGLLAPSNVDSTAFTAALALAAAEAASLPF